MSAIQEDVLRLYRESIVLDAAVPSMMQDLREWRRYYDTGISAIFATVVTTEDMPVTIERVSRYLELIKNNPRELMLAESVRDIENAKRDGKLAVALHFQNARPLGRDVGMVDIYKRLGVGVIQLCYNYRNNLGDGCLEPENAGLSQFGRKAVSRMNSAGVVVDLSHTGVRTTMTAMECSSNPDVFTHANARGVYDHPRNLTDEQIKMLASKRGVIGICSFPGFITDRTTTPSVADLLDHLDYMVSLVGIDHVGLGTDFFHDSGYTSNIELGNWDPQEYPVPPWHYPLDGSNTFQLAMGLHGRGYSESDIKKVLGENFMRVLSLVWN
ncbi:dipeptidase (plasmid) [Arthrobacter sp. G.S.26]|uniref:dipeptidase n=1 Tax=Arthrobacter sp. G.S.26 TaxID=3433706 RepID=UPI003D787E43